MFDVNWAPPQQETVGARRAKKASKPQASPTPKTAQRSSLVSSASSAASSKPSSRGISALGLFRKDDKKKTKEKQVDRGDAASIASSQPSISTSEATEATEASGVAESEYEDEFQNRQIAPRSNVRDSTVTESCQSSIQSEDSVNSSFSPWSATSSAYSHPFDITSKHEFQPINRHSFVMRSTEVTITSNDVTSLQRPLQEVHISSDVPNHYLDMDSSPDTSPSKEPRSKSRSEAQRPTYSKSSTKAKRPEAMRIQGPSTSDPQAWQPPSNWACPTSPTSTTPSRTAYRRQAQKPTHLSHQIKRMAAASAKIMLERLTEEWDQVTDPDFYKDIMFEKQLWLLTALALLERGGNPYIPRPIADLEDDEGVRVLSLYESKACFTFNLTFSSPPALPLHHPIPATPSLPFPNELFDAVTSLPLPTLMPAANLPLLLRECNRILLPGGTLRLMLLDATPVPGTMGTLLKAWLTKHLLGNLERKGRMREVGRGMSLLLTDAGFVGCDGEVKLGFKAAEREFPAPPPRKAEGAGDRGKGANSSGKAKAQVQAQAVKERAVEEDTMHRLSVVVGRLLWKELWGPYVSGSKFRWWWDEASIVEECRAMGTKWEGVIVEAVKRPRSSRSNGNGNGEK